VKDGQRPFIEKITQDTRDYVQSLLDDNERLNRKVAELQLELSARQQLEAQLKERVEAIQTESRSFASRYVEVEQQNTNLANLYVASYQLHGTLDRERVIEAIKEIIINLVGSEELAIWDLEGDSLALAGSFGIDEQEWAKVPLGSGVIGASAETGQLYVADGAPVDGREATLTACIPLKLDERVVGAIAMFKLLPQKNGLASVDFEMFDLLASHAASALYCTRIAAMAAR
jgi:hypothetical protein